MYRGIREISEESRDPDRDAVNALFARPDGDHQRNTRITQMDSYAPLTHICCGSPNRGNCEGADEHQTADGKGVF